MTQLMDQLNIQHEFNYYTIDYPFIICFRYKMGLIYGGVYLFIVVFVQVNVIGQIFYCVILMHDRTWHDRT